MSIEGVFAVTVHEENVDHNTFLDALEHDIFPQLNPYFILPKRTLERSGELCTHINHLQLNYMKLCGHAVLPKLRAIYSIEWILPLLGKNSAKPVTIDHLQIILYTLLTSY